MPAQTLPTSCHQRCSRCHHRGRAAAAALLHSSGQPGPRGAGRALPDLGSVPIASTPNKQSIPQSQNVPFPDFTPRLRSHSAAPTCQRLPDTAHLPPSICWASGQAHFLPHFLQQSLSWIHILPLDQLLKVLCDSQLCLAIAGILMREMLIY